MSQQSTAFEDINHLIDQAINISNNETKYHVKIVKNFQPLPQVECWRGKLTQVLLNLLLNANQAIDKANQTSNEQKDGIIQINTHFDQNANQVVIEIKDNGYGVAPQHIEKIFDPFFTTKEIGTGTGLGLHISHSIITSHGGIITVNSAIGEGTTFTINLPLKQAVKLLG